MDNISDEQLNRLADLIVDRLLEKQKELDQEAEAQEHQIAELARLTTLLQIYEEQEQYEKAHMIMNKIKKLQKRLNIDNE